MRSLAEFIMKGRGQAILAVVLTGAIPLIYFVSPVIVGLVLLRKGLREAFLVLPWAMLALSFWTVYPSMAMEEPLNLLPYLLLLSVVAMALVLRTSQSWQLTVLLAVVVGLLFEGYLRIQPVAVDALLSQLDQLFEQSGIIEPVDRGYLIAWIATIQTLMAVLLLIWARWLQAMLYNPGGFREEFHQLRIERKAALPLVLLLLLSGTGVGLPEAWFAYFALPFLFSGTALVHATVALRQMSPLWLVAFYAVFSVIVRLLVLLAVIDSWYDFRKRMRKTA
ncbi:MAG: hypothetical protein R3F41_05910 [Gammaproteobacteria bacterium]|nr:hypothetical protein [Pseudomonadales bacterium]